MQESKAAYASETLVISDGPIDTRAAIQQCDVAVLLGSHASTCESLLAGKPVLLLPRLLEHRLKRPVRRRLGAGLIPSSLAVMNEIEAALGRLVNDSAFAASSQRFASKYADFNAARQIEEVCSEIVSLARTAGRSCSADKPRITSS